MQKIHTHTHTYDYMKYIVHTIYYYVIYIYIYIYIHSCLESLLPVDLLLIFLYQYISFISLVNKCTFLFRFHILRQNCSIMENIFILFINMFYFQKTLLISDYTTLTPINTVWEWFLPFHKLSQDLRELQLLKWNSDTKNSYLLLLLCPLIVSFLFVLTFQMNFEILKWIKTTWSSINIL